MVAHGWLAAIEDPREVAATHRCSGRIGDQAQDAEPDRVRQQLETPRQFVCLIGSDRFDKDGLTAGDDLIHGSIIPSY